MGTNERDLTIRTGIEGAEAVRKEIKGIEDQLLNFKKNTALLGDVDPFKAMREGGGKFAQLKIEDQIKQTVKGFGEAEKSVFDFSKVLGSIPGTAGTMFRTLESGFAALASPVGIATLAVSSFVGIMLKAASVTEGVYREMRSLTAVTGTTVEETNVLADAFKLMGFEGDMMTRTMFRLSMEIENGGKRLAAYGISVRDAEGGMRSTGEVFEETLEKLSQIGSASQRNAALMQLFGRAGRELAPILDGGAASLEKFKEKARDVGIMTQEDMTRTRELIQAKAALSDAFEDMWIVIGRSLIPALTKVVEVINFFVEGITAIIGLGVEWIRWMVTSNEALDPLSVTLKAVAAAIWAIGKGIEYVRSFGKGVADFLVPPVGKGGEQGKSAVKAKSPGEIITPDDVNETAKLREAQLKIDQKYFGDLRLQETGSKVEQLKMIMGYNELIIQNEREKTAQLLALTTDPVAADKLSKELAQKEIQAAGERQLALLQLRQAEAEDAKKSMDDQVKARKDASDLEVRQLEMQKETELRLIDRVDSDEKTKIQDRLNLELDSSRQVTEAKKGAIDAEIAANKALAAQYSDNMVLQQEIQRKLMDLAQQRANVELDQIARVNKARDDAAKAEQDRRDKEAGMLGQLIKMAEEQAKLSGRKTITTADIGAAQQRQELQSRESLGQFFGGGAVDPEKLRAAMEFQQFQRQLQQQGSTTGSILSSSFGQAQKTFTGLGYDAATQAYGRGDVGMGNIMYQQAEGQAKIERAAAGIPGDPYNVGRIQGGVKEAGDKAINDLIGRIPGIMGNWFENMKDGLIRGLEQEASRI